MNQTYPWQILSGSWLKILAMLSMLVDHGAGYWMSNYSWASEPLCSLGTLEITWMFICRGIIGRLAFPIFGFLLVEGFLHTRDVKRYLLTMLGWAVITQPCCNLMHGVPWYTFWNGLNVLFTLSMGLLSLIVYEREDWSHFRKALCWLVIMIVSYLGRMDYGAMGVSFILLTRVLHGRLDLELAAVLGCFMKKWPFAGLAWIPMVMYNGHRGFIHGPIGKYLCYAFYPIHMLLICLLR